MQGNRFVFAAINPVRIGALLVLSLSAFGPGAVAQTIGGPGDPNSGNEYPFGYPVPEYQQVYASSNFATPLDITGITFFNTQYNSGSIDSANYQIELSTTSAAVNGLSNTFANNLGADNTTVFDGTLSGSANPSFTIPTSLFHYDPAAGNLLLTIIQTGSTGASTVFLDADNGDAGGVFSRKYSLSSTTTADNAGFDSNWGLVTRFDSSAVPEPGAYAVFGSLGLAGAAFLRRKRSR
jgi:hypothetical protein